MAVEDRAELRAEHLPHFRRLLSGLLGTEIRAARRALSRSPLAFRVWVESFYREHEASVVRKALPLVRDYGKLVAEAAFSEVGSNASIDLQVRAGQYTGHMARRLSNDSVAQFRQLLRDEEEGRRVEAISDRLVEWEEKRALWTSEREATQAGGAFAKFAFAAAGTERLVWRAVGESCPLCQAMDGRTVSITRYFMDSGDELEADAEDGKRRLVTEQRIGHPPLHGMGGKGGVCDCLVGSG